MYKKEGGRLKSEKTKTHLGERKVMNCGEEVEIVNYYNYTDIDVRFPDGYVKRHAQYTNFKRGGISRPTSERLMETRVMKDGNKATIIAYRNCNNIDVQFGNGCIREHVRYEKFKIGEIYMKNTKKKAKAKNNDIAKTTSASCIKRMVSAEEFRMKGRLAYYN